MSDFLTKIVRSSYNQKKREEGSAFIENVYGGIKSWKIFLILLLDNLPPFMFNY
jgi:hypothetical protein